MKTLFKKCKSELLSKIALIPMLLLFLHSCTDSAEIAPVNNPVFQEIASKSGLDLNDPNLSLAIALSDALRQEAVRNFVYEKTIEKFDGDFNFLWKTTKNQSIGGPNSKSVTFEQALFGDQSNFRTLSTEFDPLLQIAMRGNYDQVESADGLDPETVILYLPPNQNLTSNPIVPAFGPNGAVFEWDVSEEPDHAVLVISLNERLVKVPKSNPDQRILLVECLEGATPYFSDGSYDYFFYDQYFCGGGGGIGGNPGGGSGGGTNGCVRDQNNNHDNLDRARFESMYWMREAEAWLDGAPEVYYIMFTGASQPHLAQLPPKSLPVVDRSRWKDCGVFSCNPEWVFNIDLEMFNWDPQLYGRAITIQFYEYDPGDSESRTSSISVKDALGITQTFSRTWTVSNNDFDLNGTPVDYCDDAMGSDLKIYETGRFRFGMTIDG